MNPLGVSNMLTFLQQKAYDENKQIWLIDHRSISFGGFEKIIRVVKTKNGSKLEVDGHE
jgi:hypothetical protein